MATIADVFLRLRIDKSQVKNDAESGLKSVDTKSAGRQAGSDFGNEFSKSSSDSITKSGNKGGQDYAKKFSEGFSVKRALIATAITGALAAGPAAIAAAGAAVGVGFAVAAGAAIYKSLTSQLKAAGKDLTAAQKSGNKEAIANAQAQVKALQQQLAAYDGVKHSVQDLRDTLIQVGNKALVTSGILGTAARVITGLGTWVTAHQGIFVNLFKAAAPYVQLFVTFLERLIATSLPIFTRLMQQAAPAVNAVLNGVLKFVGSGLGPFLATIGQNAALFGRAFSTILGQLIPLLPLVSGLSVIVAKLVVAFPQLVPVILAVAIGFKAMLIAQSVASAMSKLKDITIITTAVTWLMNDACIGTRLGLLALSVQEGITALASRALALAMDAIPFIAIAAAIIALTFVIIKYHKQIFAAIVGTWNLIYRDAVVPVINWFTKTVPHAFSVTINWLKANWPLLIGIVLGPIAEVAGIVFKYHAQIWKTIQTTWTTILRFLAATWATIKHGIGVAWGAIAAFFVAFWRGQQQLFSTVSNAIWRALAAVWAAISHTTVAVWNAIKAFFAGWWHNISSFFSGQLNGILRVVGIVWNAVKSVTGAVWNAITGFFHAFWSGLNNLINGNLTGIQSKITSVWNTIKSVTGSVWNGIKGIVFGVWNALKGATTATFQGISDTIGRIWGGIVKVVKGPIKLVIDAYNVFADGVNFVADKVFGQHIDARIHVKGFATGGKVTQGSTETADDVLVRVSKNETILSAGHSRVLAPALSRLGVPGYAKGGVPKATVDLSAYTNPLPNPSKLIPTRIDQGVDFQGAGPMAALGAATIQNTSGGGWPGGPYMSFRLDDGILSGLSVYYAENIRPLVKAGQHVKKGAHIADWFDGGTGIEMGFDDGTGSRPLSQTKAAGSISGANLPGGGTRPTQVGLLFDELLQALGLPAANNYGRTPGGSLPGNLAKLGNTGGNIGTELEALAKSVGGGILQAITTLGGVLENTLIPAPLRKALSVVAGGVGGATKALGHPAGMFLPIVGAALGKVGTWAADWANNKVLDKVASLFGIDLGGGGGGGSGPPGGAGGNETQNGEAIYTYLLKNLFGGNKIAAAGATASIWGESTWNPEAKGTGGRGLIGWTPASTLPNAAFTGNAAKDMSSQLPLILKFVTSSGDENVIADMFRATSVAQAANLWGRGVERFGINDVHSQGIQLATQFMNKNAWGGSINQPVYGIGANGQGYSFAENGPERIVPGGKDPLLRAVERLTDAVNAVPARTAAGTARAINAPKGQEAQAAVRGAR